MRFACHLNVQASRPWFLFSFRLVKKYYSRLLHQCQPKLRVAKIFSQLIPSHYVKNIKKEKHVELIDFLNNKKTKSHVYHYIRQPSELFNPNGFHCFWYWGACHLKMIRNQSNPRHSLNTFCLSPPVMALHLKPTRGAT